MIEIRCFRIQDEIKILNSNHHIYSVIGYKKEEYFYKGKLLEHITYCLSCINANLPEVWFPEEAIVHNKPNRIDKNEIDRMLDDYNKHMELYHLLNDETHKKIAEELIEILKQSKTTS